MHYISKHKDTQKSGPHSPVYFFIIIIFFFLLVGISNAITELFLFYF